MMRLTLAGAILALAGCAGGFLGGAPVAQLAMFGGAVTAVGPTGYCADPAASRPNRGFAIFAPCVTLGANNVAAAVSAIITVQVGESGSAIVHSDPAGFAAVLGGASGPTILARGGDAKTVTVNTVIRDDARVSVYFTDNAAVVIDGAQNAEWRSFVDLGDRLVTVSVRGFDAAPLLAQNGEALLDQSINALIAANSPMDN
ncbi:MAG: dihydroxy-acid dehydratase [Yoonia sp.]|nr:dihydroxy-acid dehydratase [Yoonia sp.]